MKKDVVKELHDSIIIKEYTALVVNKKKALDELRWQIELLYKQRDSIRAYHKYSRAYALASDPDTYLNPKINYSKTQVLPPSKKKKEAKKKVAKVKKQKPTVDSLKQEIDLLIKQQRVEQEAYLKIRKELQTWKTIEYVDNRSRWIGGKHIAI